MVRMPTFSSAPVQVPVPCIYTVAPVERAARAVAIIDGPVAEVGLIASRDVSVAQAGEPVWAVTGYIKYKPRISLDSSCFIFVVSVDCASADHEVASSTLKQNMCRTNF